MELIDRRKLVSDFWQGVEDASILSFEDTDELMEKAPTVDAVEVVHGRWDKYTDERFNGYDADGRIRYRKVRTYYCDKCGRGSAVKENYCPNCGAKMDGDWNG